MRDYEFIEEVSREGFKEIIQETADSEKQILFILVDNELKHEVIEQERYRDKTRNAYYYEHIFFEEVKETITVLTWKVESGDLNLTCLIGGKIEVIDLNKLYLLCFSCNEYNYNNGLKCNRTKSDRIIEITSLRGVHNFNLDLYNRLKAQKLYKINERLRAKSALLGFGEIFLSDKSELIRLSVGRQGILQIPDTCKIIKRDSIDLRNANILKVGAGVEKCEEYPFFYTKDDINANFILEFDSTSAEIVSKLFLEMFFHTHGGESITRRTTIKVAKGLTEVLCGLILSAMDEKVCVLKNKRTYVSEVKKYFESWSKFNIRKGITKEQVISVLDNIAKYIEKIVVKPLNYTEENITKYRAFADIVLAFESSFVGFLSEEEYGFYGNAFGAITKFCFYSGGNF